MSRVQELVRQVAIGTGLLSQAQTQLAEHNVRLAGLKAQL